LELGTLCFWEMFRPVFGEGREEKRAAVRATMSEKKGTGGPHEFPLIQSGTELN